MILPAAAGATLIAAGEAAVRTLILLAATNVLPRANGFVRARATKFAAIMIRTNVWNGAR